MAFSARIAKIQAFLLHSDYLIGYMVVNFHSSSN